MRRGLLITFEGVEGSGKSTQLRRLAESLRSGGQPVLEAREPGGTALGEAIRSVLLSAAHREMASETELLLYLASRAQLTREVIAPALQDGVIVLCDRFADATTVYQGYGRGLDLPLIAAMNRFATGGLVPDLTVLLDLDPVEGLNRVRERRQTSLLDPSLDRLEAETLEFHDRVRRGYLTVAKGEPHRFRVIDASAPEERVAREIRDAVEVLIDSWAPPGRRR